MTLLLNGVVLGLIYSLVAVGYSLIFSILRMINFSHGAVYAFGAMSAYTLVQYLHINPWVAMLIGMVLTGLLDMAINKFSIEPLRKKNAQGMPTLMTTIGIAYIIQNSMVTVFGSNRNNFPNFYDFGMINIGSIQIDSSQLFLLAVCVTLLVILTCVINKTHLGLAIRAVQQNAKSASLMGINVNRIITIVFCFAGVSACIAGTLVAGYYQVVYPMMGIMMGNKTFASALLGGLGVLHGSVVGGIIVGIVEVMVAGYIGAPYRDAVSFIILIAILIFKPQGLFGKKAISKV
ncbi:MAG: branched-chain amino acid ABC transporter permease [Clostridia bacterium]